MKSNKIKNRINVFYQDPTALIDHSIYILAVKLMCTVTTIWLKIKCKAKKIEFGKNTKFYGVAFIKRYPNSKIRFMGNNTIRSDRVSNLVGVYSKTIIATHAKYANIIIGQNTGISGSAINAFKEIIIGNNVLIGANCIITDSDWHPEIDLGNNLAGPIIIEDNVWVGANSIILKNVIIGKNSVIGAGSVVSRSIPPNVIAVGNPCKVIKERVI